MAKAKEKWVLSLRPIGGLAEEPEIYLTEDELSNIVENVRGSCLNVESELMWLFREAGYPVPMEHHMVTFTIPGVDTDETHARVSEILKREGLKPIYDIDVDVM